MVKLPIGDIIRDSFKLAWRFKYLWLFGLFAAGGGGFKIPGGDDSGGIPDIEEAKAWVMAAMAMILLLVFTVGIVILILHVISKSALVYNVYQIETDGVHSLSIGWDFGWKKFWPMLGLTVLTMIVSFGFIAIIILVVVALFVMAVPLGILSLLFAIPAGIIGFAIMIVVWTYAERFLVLETRTIFDSIGEGWSLLRSQWKPSLLMLLTKVAIAIGLAIVFMVLGLMLALPGVALWAASKPLAVLYFIGAFLPLVVAGAYFGVFDSTVWTKTFLQLRAPAYAEAAAPDQPPATTETGTAPPPSDSPPPSPPLFE
jgi:hypothetical protein